MRRWFKPAAAILALALPGVALLGAAVSWSSPDGQTRPFARHLEEQPYGREAIHLGREIEPDGRIRGAARTGVFMMSDDIYIHVVPELEPGTKVDLDVMAAPDERRSVWDERKTTTAALGTFFHIPSGSLPPGHYRVRIKAGAEALFERDFRVSDGRRTIPLATG